MILFNFHTHCNYCDGTSPPEEYVRVALVEGFSDLGFSSHSPVPFRNHFAIQNEQKLFEYGSEISRLKGVYQKRIRIWTGLEIDFIPGVTPPFLSFKEKINLDYTIGGVHLIAGNRKDVFWFIDGPLQEIYDEGLLKVFDGNIRAAVSQYWNQLRLMIEIENPDVVAHLDKIKMHNRNRFFSEDEPWYQDQLDETLELIFQKGTIIEVNTRGLYKGRHPETFPGTVALKKIYQLGIPVTVSSDAHHPSEISLELNNTLRLLKEIGFRSVMCLGNEGWYPLPLEMEHGKI